MLHCVLVKVCNVKGGKKKTEVKLLSQLHRERAVILLLPTACQELWGTKKEPLLKYKLPSSPNNRFTFERADDHFNPSNSDELECLSHTLCQHVILQWFRGQQPDHCIYNSISFDHQLRPADLHLKFSSSVAMVQVQMPLPCQVFAEFFLAKGVVTFVLHLSSFPYFAPKDRDFLANSPFRLPSEDYFAGIKLLFYSTQTV